MALTVGVLALQGDFQEHIAVLSELGVSTREVRSPKDLSGVDGLILPGGESTTMSMLLESSGLLLEVAKALSEGLFAFGTCAGMILLAREVLDGRSDQNGFALMDIAVRRNGFGRQIKSFEADLVVSGIDGPPVRAVFIRAPVVEKVAKEVAILAEVSYSFDDDSHRVVPVVCAQDRLLACSFHPELTGDTRLHQLFVSKILSEK